MYMNNQAKVGLFVVIIAIVLIVTVYYVGNAQWGRHLTPYRTYLRYAGGVEPGSEVLFGGIQVGRVTAVRAWNQDPTKIEILLEVKEGTPVNGNSVAKLGAVSIMSSPAISVTTGTNDAPRLKPSEVIRSEETTSLDDMARKLSGIADSAQNLIAQVQDELKGITGRADILLANLNDATGPANRENLAGILRQANRMVAEQSPKIDRITDQILLASQDADSAVRKAGPLMDHADATVMNVNTTIDQLRDPVQQDLAELRSTMEQAKSLIGSIQTVVQSNDDNIRETIDNLRIASENLAQLTDHVNHQPWSLVRIRQPKDRKVPK
jgi:phospholipid/cholesterol/gamma-HCH transport system substrate-binding protein